jgi:competence protein ComFC
MSYPGPREPTRLQRMLQPVATALKDLVFPRLCAGCKTVLDSELDTPRSETAAWLCKGCTDKLIPVEPPYCERCGEVYDGAITGSFRCWNCEGRKYHFDFAIAAYRAQDVIREIIHSFKYGRQLHLRGALACLTLRTLAEPRLEGLDLSSWLLVPVPLHITRETDREYNQSRELATRLSELTGIPMADVLRRVRATQVQARLDREERLKNLRGAFQMRRPRPWRRIVSIKGRSILLVDDVFTTGATTSECARVLRQEGGAEKVVVITAARG